MINNKINVVNNENIEGYLIYKNNIYVFNHIIMLNIYQSMIVKL